MDRLTNYKKNLLFWLIILAGIHLFFLFYAVRQDTYLIKDSYEYLFQAKNLMEGEGWYAGNMKEVYQPHLESRRPPFYAFFITLIQVSFKNDYFILIIQNILSMINIFGLIYLLMKLKVKNHYIFVIPLLLIFFPSQFIFSNLVMSEILFQSCIFWSFFFIVLYVKENKMMQLVLHVIFISLAILTKPVLYLFWIPLILFFIFLWYRNKLNFRYLPLSLLPLITVLSISLYNESKTGYFHYSSIKTTNLLAYNVYSTLRLDHTDEEAKTILENIFKEAEAESGNYKEYSNNLNKRGTEIIKNNSGRYAIIHFKGMINFFIDTGRHDMFTFFIKDFEEIEKGIRYYYGTEGLKGAVNYLKRFPILFNIYSLLILIVNVLLFMSVIAFLFNRNISLEIKIITILIIVYIAFLTGPIGSARFKVAVYPLVLFTVPFFINYIKNSDIYKKIRWR